MRHFFTFVWNASSPYFGRETNERAKYTRRERPGGHGTRGMRRKEVSRGACISLARLSLAESRDYSQSNICVTENSCSELFTD